MQFISTKGGIEMKVNAGFCDLVKVHGEWKVAVSSSREGVSIFVGDSFHILQFIEYGDIEDHIRRESIPKMVETLQLIATG